MSGGKIMSDFIHWIFNEDIVRLDLALSLKESR
jgi:hypothetical protein